MAYFRFRQICLVAPDLGPAERAVTDVLGLAVCYRDPQVGKYGLENALWPVGDMFLEVVSPTRPGTAAGRFLQRAGAPEGATGGYMAIFDCDDPERRATHARGIGVRVITEVTHDAYTGVQLHPRDCRAAMIEFNRADGGDRDPQHYAPAGPNWLPARRTDVTRAIEAVEIASPAPQALAAHWAAILEHPLDRDGTTLRFAEATLRFVPSPDGTERMSALAVTVADPAATLSRADASGLARTGRGFIAAGVEWVPRGVE